MNKQCKCWKCTARTTEEQATAQRLAKFREMADSPNRKCYGCGGRLDGGYPYQHCKGCLDSYEQAREELEAFGEKADEGRKEIAIMMGLY
jgi:hypothetical protein